MRARPTVAFLLLLTVCVSLHAQSPAAATANQAPQSGYEEVSYFSIRVAPSFTEPLGDLASFFGFAGAVDFSAEYRLPVFPNLFLSAGLGYEYVSSPFAGQSASLPRIMAGVGLQFPIVPWLSIKAGASGGYYYGVLNDLTKSVGSGNPCLAAQAGLQFELGPTFSLEGGATYRYFGGLYSSLGASLGTSLHFVEKRAFAPPPMKEIPKGLSIGSIELGTVFPVFRKYYDDHPIGRMQVTNVVSTPIRNLTVTFFIKEYMDTPKRCAEIKELKPTESATIDLYALLTDRILEVTEATKVAVELVIEYTQDGTAVKSTESATLRVYDRNASIWDDDRRAAAFVTSKDPAVLLFSRNVASIVRSRAWGGVNDKLLLALAIHEALRTYNLAYNPDPSNPYSTSSTRKDAPDFLQFPRQTLEYKAGDCDDLSILYSALLEALGVETAFITVPGHIYMAINSEMRTDEARKTFSHVEDIIFKDSTAWIPIEVTLRAGDFHQAWQEGAKEWRENSAREQASFYKLHEAWNLYEPVQLPGSSTVVVPDEEKLAAAILAAKESYVNREIAEQLTAIQARMRSQGESSKGINELGTLYARYGLLDRGEKEFQRIVAKEEYVPALINLGNVYFLRGDMDQATTFYDRAYRREPQNARVLLGLARVNQATENYGAAHKFYTALKAVDQDLAQQFAYLELKGEEASRAADASQTKGVVIWEQQ